MTDHSVLLVGLGIALGLIFFHRTGYSPGGIITPGFIALELGSPERVAAAFVIGGCVAALLSLVVRATGVYGRQRTGIALLLALAFRLFAGGGTTLSYLWIGWVVPGLIGADMQRQGAIPTIGAALSTAFASAMAARLLISAGALL